MAELRLNITKGPKGFGFRVSPSAVVTAYTAPDCPAELAGLPIGAQVLRVDGGEVATKPDVVARLQAAAAAGRGTVEFVCAAVPDPGGAPAGAAAADPLAELGAAVPGG